jgi:hypothetical protein
MALKRRKLEKPETKAISVMAILLSSNSFFAICTRCVRASIPGGAPRCCMNNRVR